MRKETWHSIVLAVDGSGCDQNQNGLKGALQQWACRQCPGAFEGRHERHKA